MALPKLSELLNDKFVIILGAGASKDYGFPVWEELKIKLLNELQSLVDKAGNSNDIRLKEDSDISRFWIKKINDHKNKDKTIDDIISEEFPNNVWRDFIVIKIQEILYSSEINDKSCMNHENLWIYDFTKKFISLLESYRTNNESEILKILRNLHIVSLNYERCFSYHFFENILNYFSHAHFQDRNFLSNRKVELTEFFKIWQPHGSLGRLYPRNEFVRSGNPVSTIFTEDGTKFTNFNSPGNQAQYGIISNEHSKIELVGEGDLEGNYEKVNDVIKSTENCLVIGLSEHGIQGSKFDWAQFEKIYYSGQLNRLGKNENVEALDMNADGIVKSL